MPANFATGLFKNFILILAIAALIFISAGTIDYWQAWVFLLCYLIASVAMSVYLFLKDPELLARRMRGGPTAEKSRTQKIIMSINSIGFVGLLVIPALDHRFGWTSMSIGTELLGDILLLAGWLAILFVFKANSFASATIEIANDQKVISTGPYAIIRHPMYAGGLILLLGIPLALGSWWGTLAFVAILPALIWRLLDEEEFLARRLTGYMEYQKAVPYRLLPGGW